MLSILGVDDRRTVEELDALLGYTGHRVTPELVGELARLFRGVLWQTAGAEPPCPDPADRQAPDRERPDRDGAD